MIFGCLAFLLPGFNHQFSNSSLKLQHLRFSFFLSHTQVPIYTYESAGDQPDALNTLFSEQKKLFLSVAKSLNDERAVNRQGSFLKRVEVLNVGVL